MNKYYIDVSTLVSAIAVIVTVVTFLINFIRTKKVETMQEIDKIFDLRDKLSGEDTNKNYLELVDYMRSVERFAIGVNEKLYYKSLVKKQLSIVLKKQYQTFMKELIDQRRKQFKRDDYYINIEKLIKSFEK